MYSQYLEIALSTNLSVLKKICGLQELQTLVLWHYYFENSATIDHNPPPRLVNSIIVLPHSIFPRPLSSSLNSNPPTHLQNILSKSYPSPAPSLPLSPKTPGTLRKHSPKSNPSIVHICDCPFSSLLMINYLQPCYDRIYTDRNHHHEIPPPPLHSLSSQLIYSNPCRGESFRHMLHERDNPENKTIEHSIGEFVRVLVRMMYLVIVPFFLEFFNNINNISLQFI